MEKIIRYLSVDAIFFLYNHFIIPLNSCSKAQPPFLKVTLLCGFVSGCSRETESIESLSICPHSHLYLYLLRKIEIHYKELGHMIIEAKSHDLPSASWRSGKTTL